MKKTIRFLSNLINTTEAASTFELDSIVHSKKYGHDVCRMHIIGTSHFPLITAKDILSDPEMVSGIDKEDLVTITRLDESIKAKKRLQVIETDRNGIVTLEDENGKKEKCSEKKLSTQPEKLDQIRGRDAHRIGYRVGFKEGNGICQQKKTTMEKILGKFKLRKQKD